MTIYTPAKEINCEYFSECSLIKNSQPVFDFKNLVKNECSRRGITCEERVNLINNKIKQYVIR